MLLIFKFAVCNLTGCFCSLHMNMKINEYMNFYRNKENYVSYSLDNISFMSALKLLFLSFFHNVFSKSISATHIPSDWKRILESLHVAFVL